MQENGKKILLSGVKSGILCFIVGTIFVLITALAAKWFTLGETAINIVSQVLRALAVVCGVLFFVKDGAYLPKALIAAGIYWLLGVICQLVCGGKFMFGQAICDLVIAFTCAVIIALLKARK